MLPLEGDKEAKLEPQVTIAEKLKLVPQKRKKKKAKARLKILTQNKFLTRLSILLAQIKAGYNSNKFKNEVRLILYLLY